MNELVSVIVPVYNVEEYIDGCITSLLTQTYDNIEIILVDDGSPDDSGKICDEYEGKDNRIVVIHKENGGLSSARNAGLDIAKGDYIMFVDSDDYLADNTVEILLKANDKHNADLIQFNLFHTTEAAYSKKHMEEECEEEIIFDLRQMYWKMFKTVGSGESACSKFYKKHLFNDLRFKEGIIHEDVYFTMQLLQKVDKALYLNISPYYYVIRSNSIITSSFTKKNLDNITVSEYRISEFNKLNFSDLENYAKEKYFFMLTNLWCSAVHAGDKESKKAIEKKIKIFTKTFKFSKKNELLYKISNINIKLLYLYYLYKKYKKQI